MSALHEPDRLPGAGDPPSREPMLRMKQIESYARNAADIHVKATCMDDHFDQSVSDAFRAGEQVGESVMYHYESLIDKGVLAVVKTAKRSSLKKVGPVSSGGDYLEHECGGLIHETQDNFCPECGTMIVDQ